MASQAGGKDREGKIRVMVVDDSAVIRGLLSKTLDGDPEIAVATTCTDGKAAIEHARKTQYDVIVLDIEMPVMDGLTALPEILKVQPRTRVLIASTLTARGADISMRALHAGAAEYVPKPSSTRDMNAAQEFRNELINKVKALGTPGLQARTGGNRGGGAGFTAARQQPAARGAAPAGPVPPKPQPQRDSRAGSQRNAAPESRAPAREPAGQESPGRGTGGGASAAKGEIQLRGAPNRKPELIAIGSSTGGPQALFEVVAAIGPDVPQPVLITQHMPATFTTILADHITRSCKVSCVEAQDGMPLESGRIYLAPGDYHMVVRHQNKGRVVKINQDPPENYCRPAVDPMMRSVAESFGSRAVGVILTGMGYDGLRGCEQLVKAGGAVVAQDEETSVVWGMPGAVAQAGLCSAVLPLKEVGPYIRKLAMRTAA